MMQAITIDGERYEVDATVAGAIHEAAGEIETLRNVLMRLAIFVGGVPCWCQAIGGEHTKTCHDARQLRFGRAAKTGSQSLMSTEHGRLKLMASTEVETALGDDGDEPQGMSVWCCLCGNPTTRDPIYGDLCYRCCRAENE